MNDQNGFSQRHLMRTKDTLWTSGRETTSEWELKESFSIPGHKCAEFFSIHIVWLLKVLYCQELLEDAVIEPKRKFQLRATISDLCPLLLWMKVNGTTKSVVFYKKRRLDHQDATMLLLEEGQWYEMSAPDKNFMAVKSQHNFCYSLKDKHESFRILSKGNRRGDGCKEKHKNRYQAEVNTGNEIQ